MGIAPLHPSYRLRDFLSRAGGRRQAAFMLRVRLWAWPPHVMKLGPIGIAGNAEQSVPSRHDHAEATEKRHRWRLRDERAHQRAKEARNEDGLVPRYEADGSRVDYSGHRERFRLQMLP